MLLLAACAGTPERQLNPVGEQARLAFLLARRADAAGDRAEAEEAARRAARLAPDWESPWRWLDDSLSAELRGPAALAEHWEALEKDPDDPLHLYLAGRLERAAGAPRFARATRVAPGSAWAWHGRAYRADLARRKQTAIEFQERALVLARAPHDQALFASALARYLRKASRAEDAAEMLADLLASEDFEQAERLELRISLTEAESSAEDPALNTRAGQRAYDLLGHPALSSAQMARLLRLDDLSPAAELLAMGPGASPVAGTLRTSRLLREGASPLAIQLTQQALDGGETLLAERAWQLASFEAGSVSAALARWRAALPRQVIDDAGMPRQPELARLVRAGRALQGQAVEGVLAAVARELGDALLGCGWFAEAKRLAQRVPGGDLDYALELDRKARAGLEMVASVSEIADELDGKGSGEVTIRQVGGRVELGRKPSDRKLDNLGQLLEALAVPLARTARVLAEPRTWSGGPQLLHDLARAPRLAFGWIGAVLHPGPLFSAQDQRLGRGTQGATVPGTAAAFSQLGRLFLAGDALGVPLDLTLLRVLFVEERAGEHLGRPWNGTIFWCDGAEVKGRAGRVGANLSGAALHEGYWIDVEVLRSELGRWKAVKNRFEGRPEAIAAALDQPALPAVAPKGSPQRGDAASVAPLLGQADRVRLAVLADRGGAGRLGAVALDELVETTAVHEEGHLCDRAEFYPIGAHLWRVISFAVGSGFSAQVVQQRLEYRAELVALAAVPDPRLPLVDLLDAAENGGTVTPHAAAYTLLLEDLLDLLLEAVEADPAAWPSLDPTRRLALQTHRIGPEQLRALSVRLARKRGLVGSGFQPAQAAASPLP